MSWKWEQKANTERIKPIYHRLCSVTWQFNSQQCYINSSGTCLLLMESRRTKKSKIMSQNPQIFLLGGHAKKHDCACLRP